MVFLHRAEAYMGRGIGGTHGEAFGRVVVRGSRRASLLHEVHFPGVQVVDGTGDV